MLPLALPAPYDYLVPKGMQVAPGQFVVVPLGPVDYLGVVWPRPEGEKPPEIERKKLREIIELVDDVPPLPRVSLTFADWVASYTLSSPGMVLRMMMSAGRAFDPPAPRYGVRLAGPPPERMTPARARVLAAANNGLTWVKSSLAEAAGVSPGVIDGLVDSGALIAEPLPDWHDIPLDLTRERATLTKEQREAARELLANTARRIQRELARRRDRLGQDRSLFRGDRRGALPRQAGARADARDRVDQSVHRPLRGALRRAPRRMAFRRVGAASRPHLAGGCREQGEARGRRALCPVPALHRSRPDRRR